MTRLAAPSTANAPKLFLFGLALFLFLYESRTGLEAHKIFQIPQGVHGSNALQYLYLKSELRNE